MVERPVRHFFLPPGYPRPGGPIASPSYRTITPVQPWAQRKPVFTRNLSVYFFFQEPQRCRTVPPRLEDSLRLLGRSRKFQLGRFRNPFPKSVALIACVCVVFKTKQRKQQPIKMKYFQFPPTLSVICPRGSTIFPSLLTGDNEWVPPVI